MEEAVGLRARKKARTRRTIEEVALDLFDKQGFDATTIDEIAAAADISPRTFFHYFHSKEDVVLADYSARLERIIETINAASPDQPPWQALRTAFRIVGADYEEEREKLIRRFRIMWTAPSVTARNLQLQAQWEDAVTAAVAEWLDVNPNIDMHPRLIAGAALSAMRAAMRRWLVEGGSLHLPDCIADCFDVLEDGLGKIVRTD
ncbi:MAG: TetR family transcriptional regulator [Actinomycetota bacterium]|nr:TetR family transcriptional regulator [Actinomycetota bacterium]